MQAHIARQYGGSSKEWEVLHALETSIYLQATFSNACRSSKICCVPAHPSEPGSLPRPTFGLKLAGCITSPVLVTACQSHRGLAEASNLESMVTWQLKPYNQQFPSLSCRTDRYACAGWWCSPLRCNHHGHTRWFFGLKTSQVIPTQPENSFAKGVFRFVFTGISALMQCSTEHFCALES